MRAVSFAPIVEHNTAFVFPGQGSQYAGMGEELYEKESVFRRSLQQGSEMLKPYLGLDLCRALYEEKTEEVNETWLAQLLVRTTGTQVAAVADRQWLIRKTTTRNAASTDVLALDAKGRREEIARMLSGAEVTAEARAAADKLLATAG